MRRLPYAECKPVYDGLKITFTPEQHKCISTPDRFPLIIGGERGGKTFGTAGIMLPHIVLLPLEKTDEFLNPDGSAKVDFKEERPRDPHFMLFGPTYAEPRREFDLLEGWLRELDLLHLPLLSKPKEGQWSMVTKYGVVIQTWSCDDPNSIRSFDIEGGAACEAGNTLYRAIERMQGRISNKRSFLIYSGTLEDAQRWYHESKEVMSPQV